MSAYSIYSTISELTHDELVSDAIAAAIITEDEAEDFEDWQLVNWLSEQYEEDSYHAHAASFYTY